MLIFLKSLFYLFLFLILMSCNKNPESLKNSTEETVTDIDGNIYQTVKIGDQWWMTENLKTIHFRNGEAIPLVTDDTEWSNLTTGAYSNYDNNPNNNIDFGRLYNWYAVTDERNIAPLGWHIPTDSEWKQLEMHIGLSQSEANSTGMRGTDEGGKLKATGTDHWNAPNIGATNSSGFATLAGGYRTGNGIFDGKGQFAFFWMFTAPDSNNSWYRVLYYNSSDIRRYSNNNNRVCGYSVRCVCD